MVELKNNNFGAVLLSAAALSGGCALSASPDIYYPPSARKILSDYGSFVGPAGGLRGWPHAGIDIETGGEEKVYAAADGLVVRANYSAQGEYRVMLYHGRDADGQHVITDYFHNSLNLVEKGQQVKRGDAIAVSGTLRRVSFTHFGVLKNTTEELSRRWKHHDPHDYWVDGPGKITCFDAAKVYAKWPIRFTYPVKCREN